MELKNLLLLLCTFTVALPIRSTAQEQAVYFAGHPVLTPEGDTLIFAYEGDLWKVAAGGGLAVRLTAMEGIESRPSISPDGRWLAFTGRQYGNGDVYLMPLAGGAIRQLTFHEADDEVESWSWDNRRIFFRSDRYNRLVAARQRQRRAHRLPARLPVEDLRGDDGPHPAARHSHPPEQHPG